MAVGARRLFFAIWPDEATREHLQRSAAAWLARVEGRALAPADWHVTLCFLGQVPAQLLAPLQVEAAEVRAAPFSVELTALGYWRAARVLAATAAHTPASATQLAEALRGAAHSLGLRPDDKPLKPHVTLMRGVSPARWQRARASLPGEHVALDLSLRVEEFRLVESLPPPAPVRAPVDVARGADPWPPGVPRYAALARWSLRG